MPAMLELPPATRENFSETPYGRQLPLNTAIWFMLSGMLMAITLVVAILYGLTSAATVLTVLSSIAAFICGSMSWPDASVSNSSSNIEPFREEDIDWKEVERTLNIAGWLMISGVCLGIALVAAPLYAHTVSTLIGVEVLSAIVTLVGNAIAAGIWDLQQETVVDRTVAAVRPLVSSRR